MIYQHFVTENPDVKVGFSTFAMLRPKWCVPGGSSGTHNVCVCTYHQNVKLMISCIDGSLDYKEALKFCMCGVNNENCMLHHCVDFPNKSNISNYLKELLPIKFSENDVIKYKQWVSTDRSQLEDKEEFVDDFVTLLSDMLYKLTEHHFITKNQNQDLKGLKDSLKPNQCIIILDFAENCLFVVQDAAQSFHWNNSQATIHPFLVCHKPNNGDLCHRAFACISDHIIHDTVAVYVFVERLINDYVKLYLPKLQKIH